MVVLGGRTLLAFTGAVNAEQAQKITAAVKSLVQSYLCQANQVNIESVHYDRHNGYAGICFVTLFVVSREYNEILLYNKDK